ncbi:TM2 domain-containing protein biscotti isoform X2 [Linepithema humile]|uniref:TM2 domain-containing protein biscotti isoform X2 n=1 Tax=Linepithema humile TaxID=83485 RepID=UPI00062375D7|nr:PREDICTED: TM2 domain-containing protein CG10795 isoform X2 [Linepithema humile]
MFHSVRLLRWLLILVLMIALCDGMDEIDCNNLRMGQYICPHPDYDFIDPKTQQPRGCTKENKAKAADGITCTETKNNTFKKDIPCKWTNGYSFETALLLSIFLGMFGADRFYLGYPALGLLKLSTLGFLFLGQFADVILIATQIVGPADGSHYVMPYYGAGINIVTSNNFTYRVPQYDY